MDKVVYIDDQIKIEKRYDDNGNLIKALIGFVDETGESISGFKHVIVYDRNGNIIAEG